MAALLSPLSEDPWAAPSSHPASVAQATSTSTGYGYSAASSTSNRSANTILDEDSLPAVYAQAWQAALAASSSATSNSTGGSAFTFSNGAGNAGYITFTVLHKVLSGCAGLSATETERVCSMSKYGRLGVTDILACIGH